MTITIRPARAADVSAIGEIADATELFPSEMLPAMIAGYLDNSAEDIWFTADDPVAGFGFCEPERMTEGTWNLLAIGVAPGGQGAGVGRAMLRYLEAELAARGARILLVETLGAPKFDATRRFYLANGFVEEARIRDFYEEGGDKIVFWKRV